MSAPFGRRPCAVVANARVGEYRLLSIADDPVLRPRPGQFYMLARETHWGGEGGRPYLARAFSHCRAHGDGRLDFLIDPIGPGTARLAEAGPGDRLLVVGPLGNGFSVSSRPLLIGGGIGVAPLVALSDEIGGEVLLGFRNAVYAGAAELFSNATVVTDDGSVGRQALVTELLREKLDDGDATIYACGPPAMLEAVRAIAQERELACELALESGMACGFGACFGCVHPTREGYVRLCVDGPVLEAASLETAVVAGAGH